MNIRFTYQDYICLARRLTSLRGRLKGRNEPISLLEAALLVVRRHGLTHQISSHVPIPHLVSRTRLAHRLSEVDYYGFHTSIKFKGGAPSHSNVRFRFDFSFRRRYQQSFSLFVTLMSQTNGWSLSFSIPMLITDQRDLRLLFALLLKQPHPLVSSFLSTTGRIENVFVFSNFSFMGSSMISLMYTPNPRRETRQARHLLRYLASRRVCNSIEITQLRLSSKLPQVTCFDSIFKSKVILRKVNLLI